MVKKYPSYHTENIQKVVLIRKLKGLGASNEDLLEVYTKQVRTLLEFAAPLWHPGITSKDSHDLERVQKCPAKIISQEKIQEI